MAAAQGRVWEEIPWPFSRDAWPAGRAFRCLSAECGGDVEIRIRAKRGLCANCAAGVTEDFEVDGVSDIDTISPDFVPVADGEPVTFGALSGRSRAYTVQFDDGGRRSAVGYVVSRRPACDLLVISSEGAGANTQAARAAIHDLLLSPEMGHWLNDQLEGR